MSEREPKKKAGGGKGGTKTRDTVAFALRHENVLLFLLQSTKACDVFILIISTRGVYVWTSTGDSFVEAIHSGTSLYTENQPEKREKKIK